MQTAIHFIGEPPNPHGAHGDRRQDCRIVADAALSARLLLFAPSGSDNRCERCLCRRENEGCASTAAIDLLLATSATASGGRPTQPATALLAAHTGTAADYLIEVGQSTGLLEGKLAKKRPDDLPG